MKHYFFCCFTVILLGLTACKKTSSDAPEKGVSFVLNEHRKEDIQKVAYAITLAIPSEKSASISGNETIAFTLLAADKPLVIDFSANSSQVKSVMVDGTSISYSFVNEHIVIDKQFLHEGAILVQIEFIAGDLSLNRNDDYLYTLFVPDRASTCFPLFDQPNLKATYELTLTVPEKWEAVSNGVLKEKKQQNDKSIFVFDRTKPISSYLFAFAAGKFYKKQRHVNGREMTMYYRETDSVKVNRNEQEVFDLHRKSLTWLEDYTRIRYPFDKFDFVLIPSFQYGGMEHPGSIFYNESSLFLDEHAPVNRQLSRASLIAHETAHMWFGDLVTMDWFNDVWMKEVFANFMAAKIVQPSFPDIDHRLRFLLAHYPSAYEVDRSAGANPIIQPLENLKNAGTLYGAIIYQKAPIVMRHLERKIGEELMQQSLRDYLKKFSYGNARWDDLIQIIDEKSPENIEAWSNVWVKTSGMPEYKWMGKNIVQHNDSVADRIWQQPLQISWNNPKQDTSVNMVLASGVSLLVHSGPGFLNSDGFSYGYFSMDEEGKHYFLNNSLQWKDPAFRASMWMNCWESMVRGDGPSPLQLEQATLQTLTKESNPLLVDFLLGRLQSAWWQLLNDNDRAVMQHDLEEILWTLVLTTKEGGRKTPYFNAYRNLAVSTEGLNTLEALWEGSKTVKDLVLSEEDKITLAYELALKIPARQELILRKQLELITNPDRQKRMQFVMPALSDDWTVRDGFFESLKKAENREHESWVLEALSYLHHPLRAKQSIQYLRPTLDLLQEVQLTGDIFFPQRWLASSFNGYSSKEASAIVKTFLKENPGYPYYLRNKILQSTDMLERAARLKQEIVPR